MAFDPITLSLLAKGAGKLIGAVGPSVGSLLGARAGANALQQDPNQIAQQYEALSASMPKYGVGSGWNEYLAMAKQDPAADMQRQIAAEQEASTIAALKAGGANALRAGLAGAQRAAAQSRMGIEADSAKRLQSSLQTYAGQQQRVQDANIRMQQDLEESKFKAMRGAEQYNRQLEAQKKQAMGMALGQIAGQFGQGHFKGLGGGDTEASQSGSQSKFRDMLTGFRDMFTPEQQELLDYTSTLPIGAQYGSGMGSVGYQSNFYGSFDVDGDPSTPYKSGGMMTKGAFSHETNPIDIMQDGAKVGEMTGGEAILNPEQQKKVAKQSPYFRKLMREFAMKNRR